MRFLVSLFWLFASTSCVYRFTNTHLHPPQGVRSIAIEAIYDSSRSPIPHEILWDALQTEFIADGRLQVLNSKTADAYLRTHIKKSSSSQYEVVTSEKKSDPDSIVDPTTGEAYPLSKYSNLRVADQYSKRESFAYSVDVEIWNLRTGTRIMQKSYDLASQYVIYDGRTPSETQFINAEDGFETMFSAVSQKLARAVVIDFLSP